MKGFVYALGISCVAHAGMLALARNPAPPALDGGEVTGEVALGMGFVDLVSGVANAVPKETVPVSNFAQIVPISPKHTTAPAATALPLQPMASPSVSPTRPQDTVMAKPVTDAAPPPRLTSVEAKDVTPQPPSPPKQKTGNSEANQRKGQSDGKATAKRAEVTRKSAEPTKATNAGNGAEKSYQTYVLRRIARVPKRSAGAKGAALVGLAISPTGGIQDVRIVKGSGHAGIDKTAVDHVRRAGPFKAPPHGKSVRLVVRVESKG